MIEKIQKTPWGEIRSKEFKYKCVSSHSWCAGEVSYYSTYHIEYIIADECICYGISDLGDPFVLQTDTPNGIKKLGVFPNRESMTKWVKSHLVNQK